MSRVYRTYSAARAVVASGSWRCRVWATHRRQPVGGLALVAAVRRRSHHAGLRPRLGNLDVPLVQERPRWRLWVATIGTDLVAFSVLCALARGANFNYAALLVLPVLMAGVLTARLLALGTAASATLVLLTVAWRAPLAADAPALMLQWAWRDGSCSDRAAGR